MIHTILHALGDIVMIVSAIIGIAMMHNVLERLDDED